MSIINHTTSQKAVMKMTKSCQSHQSSMVFLKSSLPPTFLLIRIPVALTVPEICKKTW